MKYETQLKLEELKMSCPGHAHMSCEEGKTKEGSVCRVCYGYGKVLTDFGRKVLHLVADYIVTEGE